MFCPNCQAHVPPGEYRCTDCGAPIPQPELEPDS